jgi:altronate hydrolase
MTEEKKDTVRLHSLDNVVVALKDIPMGEAIFGESICCRQPIPAGHKVATSAVAAGDPILKYGQVIGFASRDVSPGDHVHTHNVQVADFARDYAIGRDAGPTFLLPDDKRATFEGILRPDGRAATRNYLGVLATVNCSASIARFIVDDFVRDTLSEFPQVDGVVSIGHGSGCGQASTSEGFRLLQKTLAGYARHPNFAGVLLVGLGCEVNQIDCLLDNMKMKTDPMLRTLNIQNAGGTAESIRRGKEALYEMVLEANRAERVKISASELTLGLECGGSDGYSGISANPALGAAVDLLVQNGGTAILSETPEIYGAEHLLTRRAINSSVGQKLVERIRWWEQYTTRLGGEINNNPSPGNKAGGLTTILEKSLGAAAKGGTTNLMDVIGYAERVSKKGLVFMDTPGYDAVSITGMVAGGANLLCFTTGRGTVCGFKPVPTVKLASNTEMYQKMTGDMDVNCGEILDGEVTVQEMGETIFRLILEIASGKKTRSEMLGYGDNEFVPWQIGPVL